MLNNEKDFNNCIKMIKIKNLEEDFYSEFDYIRQVELAVTKLIQKNIFFKKIFKKKFEIYKTALNNRKKIEIMKTIKESKMYTLISYMNNQKKVDFLNIEIILQDNNFILYALENNYIERFELEMIREYLIDLEFNKNYPEYNMLIKRQNSYKNKIDDILGY